MAERCRRCLASVGRALVFTLMFSLLGAVAPAVLAHTGGGPVIEKVTGVKGPFTFEGTVYDPAGQPLAGCPVRLLPVLPGKGVDEDNLFYRISDYDDHRTVTDARGHFVMSGIHDYPEVKHHIYRIIVNADHDLPFSQPYATGVISLAALTSDHYTFEFHTQPSVKVKLVVHDRHGRPFTGTRAVSVATGHGIHYVTTVRFTNGVGYLHTLPGDVKNPGQIALLRWETSEEAKKQDLAQGHEPGLSHRVILGMEAQQNTMLVPGREQTLEFYLDD